VPFHGLPGLHRLLREDIQTIDCGYVAVQRTLLRGFRASP
jgi:hypothetical protein